MISYDAVWQSFLNNYKASDIDIPQVDEKIYDHIRYAVMLFNNRMRTELICDDASESIIGTSNNDHLLIISHYIRLTFLINDRTYFEKLYQPFSADVGLRNFNTQLNSLKVSIKEQNDFIEKVIFNSMEDFL